MDQYICTDSRLNGFTLDVVLNPVKRILARRKRPQTAKDRRLRGNGRCTITGPPVFSHESIASGSHAVAGAGLYFAAKRCSTQGFEQRLYRCKAKMRAVNDKMVGLLR